MFLQNFDVVLSFRCDVLREEIETIRSLLPNEATSNLNVVRVLHGLHRVAGVISAHFTGLPNHFPATPQSIIGGHTPVGALPHLPYGATHRGHASRIVPQTTNF